MTSFETKLLTIRDSYRAHNCANVRYLPLLRGRLGLILVCLNIIELADGLSETSSGCPINILFLLKRNCSLLLSVTQR